MNCLVSYFLVFYLRFSVEDLTETLVFSSYERMFSRLDIPRLTQLYFWLKGYVIPQSLFYFFIRLCPRPGIVESPVKKVAIVFRRSTPHIFSVFPGPRLLPIFRVRLPRIFIQGK